MAQLGVLLDWWPEAGLGGLILIPATLPLVLRGTWLLAALSALHGRIVIIRTVQRVERRAKSNRNFG